MVKLLRRLFIKDYENTNDPVVRKSHGILGAVYGIISNTILVLIKIGAALLIAFNSNWVLFPIALFADAINNASDALSSIITLISFNLAAKPDDDEHPFGHGRIEYIAGLIVSFLVVVVAVEVFRSSLDKVITSSSADYDLLTTVLLGIAVLMKLLQAYVANGLGKVIGSPALKATATDALLDSLITGTVMVCSILTLAFGWGFLDGWFGMGISIFICANGIKSVIESSSPLIGEKIDEDLIEKIKKTALEHKNVIDVHDIICHSYGPTKHFVSLHIEISDTFSLQEAHEVAESIENRLKEELKLDATIHVDPVNVKDPILKTAKEAVESILESLAVDANAHDFRITRCGNSQTLNFDVAMPHRDDENELYQQIEAKIADDFKEKGIDCLVKINFEHPY